MGPLAIASLAMNALGSGYQIFSGIKQRREGKEDLQNLRVPELDNPYEDVQINTSESDFIREGTQRTTASLVDAARSGGVRSVMSTLPKIVEMNNRANQKAGISIDQQLTRRDYAIAREEAQNKRIRESRYMSDVYGLGQKMAVGEQNIWSGMRGMGAVAGYASRMDGGTSEANKDYGFDKTIN